MIGRKKKKGKPQKECEVRVGFNGKCRERRGAGVGAEVAAFAFDKLHWSKTTICYQ